MSSPTCTICGKSLPNRYSIAGTCEEPGCEAAFCALHWREGNRRCRKHGWKPNKGKGNESSPVSEESAEIKSMSEEKVDSEEVSPERKKQAMKETLRYIGTLGKGIAGKLMKLGKAKTPQEMIDELESQHTDNRTRREATSQKLESLYSQIAKKKKAYSEAPKARQRVLEMELKGLLSDYKSQERTLGILLENERAIGMVRSRLEEVLAYGLAGVNEDMIDDVTDRVDDAADEAEGRFDALRDLERAGKRRERESDSESMWDELDGFGEDFEDETVEASEGTAEKKKDPLADFDEFEEPEPEK
jgi:hypothetical protein